jgi:hypothetical protein
MKPCPKGAIVCHAELGILHDALACAIVAIEDAIRSDHIHHPKFRPPETRKLETERKQELRRFRKVFKEFRRIGAEPVRVQFTEAGRKVIEAGAH